ncbi:MAG: molybdopterin-dependent oxidoreductase [Acidobacteria bacterium]|nr:molybdopterin-dependent oxidoreductase [Acidobacteriota bacterium]
MTPFVGGGFGGKLVAPVAVEAARIARQLPGVPIQVAWNREEDLFLDGYRPAAVVKLRSGLDASRGAITFWDSTVAGVSQGEAEFTYEMQTSRYQAPAVPDLHPLKAGAWRAPNAHTNAFARECQLDALAAKAGMDPVTLRRRLANDPRLLHLLDLALEAFGWEPAAGPTGRGIGLACGAGRPSARRSASRAAVSSTRTSTPTCCRGSQPSPASRWSSRTAVPRSPRASVSRPWCPWLRLWPTPSSTPPAPG